MNHPLYPWVDPRNRRGTGHCRRRPGLPVSSALLLVGYGVLFRPLARFASSAPRLCVSPGIRLSMLRGASGGNAWRFDSGRGARYFFLLLFFLFLCLFFGAFFFPRQVEYSAEYCRRSETARERERERESDRQKRQREVTVRRVFDKAKKSLSLHT